MDQQEVSVKNYGTTGEMSSVQVFKKPEKLLGIRHLQTFLMFSCLTIAYALRVILSVAIVVMVDMELNDGFPHYNWEKPLPDTILSSFFWGYVVTQIPAGQLAQRFGPKILLTIAVAVCSIFSILTPLAADVGDWGMVCGCRVIQGLGQGFIFPSIHTLISSWTPTEERGRLATYVYAGAQFGTIIALVSSGVLASSSIGWPSIFYVFGSAGVLWAIVWFFLGADSPGTHRSISDEERDYIENNLGSHPSTDLKRSTPWIAIFTSMPMWALIIAHCGQNWGFWTLLTEMPSYMKDVLDFNIKSNGTLSAVPYMVMWLMSFVFSWFSDFANKRQLVSLAVSRKIFNTIGHWIPGVALIGLAYIPKGDNISPVALLSLTVGVNSATYLGFQLNHIDLSPNYAGTMMGITNCAANIMSIIGPLLVGVIVTDNKSVTQWRTIFFIASGIYFAGNLVFILFGKATIQPWNEPQPPRKAANNIAMEEGTGKDKDKDKDKDKY